MSLPPELQAALLDRRLIFVRGRLDAALANTVVAQLVLASRLASGDAIQMYIDSPGGSVTAALSVYDMMQSTSGAEISTTCTGTAGGAVVLLLAAGSAGHRFALPSARIQLADDQVDLGAGRFDNPELHAEEARRATARWRSALLQRGTQTPEQLAADMAVGRWLSASDAVEYGLIDAMVPPRGAGG